MNDIEKNRSEYVMKLETQVKHFQEQLAIFRPTAEKWEPKFSSSMEQDGTARVTLQFGGKNVTATMSREYLANSDLTSATTSVINTLVESLMIDRLRPLVEPEVERLIKNAQTLQSVSKW